MDTGSGPSIVRLTDLETARDRHPRWREQLTAQLDAPDSTRITADGSVMRGLAGATEVKIRQPGQSSEWTARVQVERIKT